MGDWYKNWYITSKQGEHDMRAAISDPVNGDANKADIKKRLDEIKRLPSGRCVLSDEQRIFIERVLS